MNEAGRPRRSPIDRFLEKVNKTDGCWLWTGALQHGYGKIALGGRCGKAMKAHRFSYELFVGPVPPGLCLDHLCRIRHCVNPNHLEAVTIKENLLRGDTLNAANAKKTHCYAGHEFTTANTYLSHGRRSCKRCKMIKYYHQTDSNRALLHAAI